MHIILKGETTEISINPDAVAFIEPARPEPGDPMIFGKPEPFCWVHFLGGNSRRVKGQLTTLKVVLETSR